VAAISSRWAEQRPRDGLRRTAVRWSVNGRGRVHCQLATNGALRSLLLLGTNRNAHPVVLACITLRLDTPLEVPSSPLETEILIVNDWRGRAVQMLGSVGRSSVPVERS
jgi:hypothetical protein